MRAKWRSDTKPRYCGVRGKGTGIAENYMVKRTGESDTGEQHRRVTGSRAAGTTPGPRSSSKGGRHLHKPLCPTIQRVES